MILRKTVALLTLILTLYQLADCSTSSAALLSRSYVVSGAADARAEDYFYDPPHVNLEQTSLNPQGDRVADQDEPKEANIGASANIGSTLGGAKANIKFYQGPESGYIFINAEASASIANVDYTGTFRPFAVATTSIERLYVEFLGELPIGENDPKTIEASFDLPTSVDAYYPGTGPSGGRLYASRVVFGTPFYVGASSQSGSGSASKIGSFLYMYALVDAPFPGQAGGIPLPPSGPNNPDPLFDTNQIIQENNSGATAPANIAGSFLTTPFAAPVEEGGYGHSETVYFDPALAVGYGYVGENGTQFTSFEVPEALPMGDDTFSIHHQGTSYPLLAGETFDFKAIDPTGVASFLLLGIDEAELFDAGDSNPPFVFGMTFAAAGLAEFSSFALTTVPEPTTIALALLGLTALTAIQRRTY